VFTEELHNLYSSTNIIRMIKSRWMRWVGHVAHIKVMRNVCKIFVGKPEGKRSLGRPRYRWEDNINTYILEKWEGRVWIVFIWLSVGTGGRLL
jgi:hypothetical protein